MATTKQAKSRPERSLADYSVYVPLGAGQLAVQKAKELSGKALSLAQDRRKDLANAYKDLADRGERLAASIRRSAYTRRATEQTKVARGRVKAAATSVRKAVGATTEATKAAAAKKAG